MQIEQIPLKELTPYTRNAYLMELDPKYCDVIIERWENFTNKKAVKVQ
jgi:DNA modification methylase